MIDEVISTYYVSIRGISMHIRIVRKVTMYMYVNNLRIQESRVRTTSKLKLSTYSNSA